MQEFGARTITAQIIAWINQEKQKSLCDDLSPDEIPQCEDYPFYKCIHNFGKQMTSNIYYTDTPFHGKYYAGIDSENRIAEIASTSFNLVPFELHQYETFKLIKLKGVDFNRVRPNLHWEQVTLSDDLFRVFS